MDRQKKTDKWSSNELVLGESVLDGEKKQINTWVKKLFLK